MRLSAYKKVIDEACKLPNRLKDDYFKFDYDPRFQAIAAVTKKARLDVGALFDCEFVELHEYIRDKL